MRCRLGEGDDLIGQYAGSLQESCLLKYVVPASAGRVVPPVPPHLESPHRPCRVRLKPGQRATGFDVARGSRTSGSSGSAAPRKSAPPVLRPAEAGTTYHLGLGSFVVGGLATCSLNRRSQPDTNIHAVSLEKIDPGAQGGLACLSQAAQAPVALPSAFRPRCHLLSSDGRLLRASISHRSLGHAARIFLRKSDCRVR